MTAIAELESLGVALVSLKDDWDLSMPSGRLMFQTVGTMFGFEQELIREYIRAGMRRRKIEGCALGRASLDVCHQTRVRDRLASMSRSQVAKKWG